MTITLDELTTELTDVLGTGETNLYTNDRRLRALNRAIQQILLWYDLDQYRVTTTLNFNSGVATLPTRMLRPVQLRNASQNLPYTQVDFEQFQGQIPRTWIYEYDDSNDTELARVYPTHTGSLEFTYMQMPEELSSTVTSLRLKFWWIRPIACRAAQYLFIQTSNFNRAEGAQKAAEDAQADAWQSERQKITGKEQQKLQSIYEDYPLIGGFSTTGWYLSSLDSTQSMLWTTINSDTTATVNYGYFTNSASRVVITLPLQANVGDTIEVAGQGAGGWRIAQNNGQKIIFGDVETTQGTGGYLESTEPNDTVRIICQVQNTTWEVVNGVIGNITYV